MALFGFGSVVFGLGTSVFKLLFFGVFLLVLIVLAFSLIKGVGQWSRNNQAPVLNVFATIVAKREDLAYRHHNMDYTMHVSHSTSYYITFEVESGDRMEFEVSGQQYGMLVENDFGTLKFQGTRFLDFKRE